MEINTVFLSNIVISVKGEFVTKLNLMYVSLAARVGAKTFDAVSASCTGFSVMIRIVTFFFVA